MDNSNQNTMNKACVGLQGIPGGVRNTTLTVNGYTRALSGGFNVPYGCGYPYPGYPYPAPDRGVYGSGAYPYPGGYPVQPYGYPYYSYGYPYPPYPYVVYPYAGGYPGGCYFPRPGYPIAVSGAPFLPGTSDKAQFTAAHTQTYAVRQAVEKSVEGDEESGAAVAACAVGVIPKKKKSVSVFGAVLEAFLVVALFGGASALLYFSNALWYGYAIVVFAALLVFISYSDRSKF
ncbi:MAG: hypothetical protein LBP79_00605, partial [Clostridiales bacterium]|nr:hypothetical protein [Clostridiales bacterium]